MPRAAAFIARRGEDVTLQTLALDTADRDATTNWPKASYTDSTIKAIVEPISSRRVVVGGVMETVEGAKLYTATVIHLGDRIIYNAVTYVITTEPVPHRKRGRTSWYSADLERVG